MSQQDAEQYKEAAQKDAPEKKRAKRKSVDSQDVGDRVSDFEDLDLPEKQKGSYCLEASGMKW
jgi:hypothetical protein